MSTPANVYVTGFITRAPEDLASRVIQLLLWLRDHLNDGRWGTFADVVLQPSLPTDLGALPPVVPGVMPDHNVADVARRGFSEPELARIGRLVAAGQLRVLAVDLNGIYFKFDWEAADYQSVQVLFDGLVGGAPQATIAARMAAAFDLQSPLLRRIFGHLRARYGLVGIVPEGAPSGSKAMRQLYTWPPSGHWLDYLSPDDVAMLGGLAEVRSLLPEHTVVPQPDGGIFAALPLPPERDRDPDAERLKDHFTAVMAARMPAKL